MSVHTSGGSRRSVLDAANHYTKQLGWRVIPVPFKRKAPCISGWNKLELTEDELPEHFSDKLSNLGVLLGEPSGRLLDVDLDCIEAIKLAPYFLPDSLTFGRKSKLRSHWIYVADTNGALPSTAKYQIHCSDRQSKRKSETLVELRSTGGQTIFPPSVHPSGENIAFSNEIEPLCVDGQDLMSSVKLLAVACLFLRHWPRTKGTRQDCAQALAGALIRAGLEESMAGRFVYAVATCAGDEEAEVRAKTVAYASMQKVTGSRLWGWPKVAELFGDEVATYARSWLGTQEVKQVRAYASELEHAGHGLEEAPAIPQHVYDLLPEIMVRAVSYFTGWHKRDVFLTALLGALSSALPNLRIHYGQAYHSTHLYFFIIARAASGKGVMPHAFRWLDQIDELLQREWLEEHTTWRQKKDAYEQSKRRSKQTMISPDPPGMEPPERCLKAGANTTAAALGERLAANQHGVFIGSTEADTFSSSNKREHGNYSHILRQAFHHEEAQVDRKTESTLRIKNPRLALVLSGTLKQFPRLMEGGVEDGLYSRFGVYSFEAPTEFQAQWATDRDRELESFTAQMGHQTLALYKLLRERRNTLYFDIPELLRPRVTDGFRRLHNSLAKEHAYALIPNVRRGVIITLRIAAVLSVWRHFEQSKPLGTAQNIVATEEDVEAAVALGLVYVEHALREALRMEPSIGSLPDTTDLGGAERMTGPQRHFWDKLPETFQTREAEAIAENLELPRSTMYNWLKRFVMTGALSKPGHGRYEKTCSGGKEERGNRFGLLDFDGFPVLKTPNGDCKTESPSDFALSPVDYGGKMSKDGADVQVVVHPKNGAPEDERGENPKVQQSTIPIQCYVGKRVQTPRGNGTIVEIPGEHQKVKVLVDALKDTPTPTRAFDSSDLQEPCRS